MCSHCRLPGPSESGKGRGFIAVHGCVFIDAHHRKDFLEVSAQAKDADGTRSRLAGFEQYLDDDGDARRVDVIDAGEVQQELRRGEVEVVVGAQDDVFRCGCER